MMRYTVDPALRQSLAGPHHCDGLRKVLEGALDGHGLLEELARVAERLGQVAGLHSVQGSHFLTTG